MAALFLHLDSRNRLEQPDHPIADPIVHAEARASPYCEVNRGGDKDEVVANAHFVGVIGLAVEEAKIVLRLFIFDRSVHRRHHRRQYFQPMKMESECRNQKGDDHHGAERRLNSSQDTETANDHKEGSDKAEESCPLWKQDACRVDRVGPAPDVTQPADQHTPT